MIKSRRIRWTRHIACMEKMRNAYKILIGKREWKRSVGRQIGRREDNMNFDRLE
jgi:hypothetical protein